MIIVVPIVGQSHGTTSISLATNLESFLIDIGDSATTPFVQEREREMIKEM